MTQDLTSCTRCAARFGEVAPGRIVTALLDDGPREELARPRIVTSRDLGILPQNLDL